jgi:predicted DNA-binding transcriptional regulator YafY
MGVPITTESLDDGVEVGYRVRPDDYYLPDLDLTPEETAALRVAVNAVSLGNRAGEGALMKLGGLATDVSPPIASLPIAPALAALFDGFRTRAVVTFTHRGKRRTVEPWGLSSKRGQWYLVGFDRDRGALRAFRADRIEGDVEVGEPDAFVTPADFRPDDHVEDRPWLLGDDPAVTVRVAVDDAHRAGMLAELGADATEADDGTIEVAVTNRAAFRTFVLGFLEHAEVLEPAEVRAEIVTWLEKVAK